MHKNFTRSQFIWNVKNNYNGKYIISGGVVDKNIKIWNISSGKIFRNYIRHKNKVRCMTICLNFLFIKSESTDHSIKIWSINTG